MGGGYYGGFNYSISKPSNLEQTDVMPYLENTITPEEKFFLYSLDYENENAKGKAEAYEKALGFNKQNALELIEQIHSAVTTGKVRPYEISQTQYGDKYKYRIPITGPNGNTKNVIAVYQIDEGSKTPRLVTNYVEKK